MGGALLVKITVHLGGLSPQNFLYWSCFSKCIDLAANVFYIVSYTLIVLNLSINSASLKIWAWLQLGHTQNMGVVAPIAPLLKFLEITTASA